MQNIIVTRHKGAVEWIKQRGFNSDDVMEHFDPMDLYVSYKYNPLHTHVIGVLPIQIVHELIQHGYSVTILVLPDVPKEERGKELTPEIMNQYGAKLLNVKALELEEA